MTYKRALLATRQKAACKARRFLPGTQKLKILPTPLMLLVVAITVGCGNPPRPSALDRLHPCKSDEGPVDAYCGTYTVFEDRQSKQGRTIDLRIVLLPALSSDAQPDPLVFLAGGPGQGAAQMARPLREVFRRVQTNRDIVLVDQRGTGKSGALNCRSETSSLRELNEPETVALERLRECMKGLKADLTKYTTTIAMDDLDEVRDYLGYDKINVYGGSYGTRAALVYLRQHEQHVRSVILDGVAPTDMRLPLFFARDAQRALSLLLADCEADEQCRAKHPNLAQRTTELLRRLDQASVKTRLVHPRTGVAEDVDIDGRFVSSVLFGALYSPLPSSLVPSLIERAEKNDFQGLLALQLAGESASENMSLGMQFSVLCAEDAPRIKPEDAQRESTGTVFGAYLLDIRMKACEFWPKASVPKEYYEPVRSNVPTLILSGELDPVTPPQWGELAAKTLPNSLHLVAPGTGHGVLGTGCGPRIINDFLQRGSVQGVDTSCLKALRRPPFFLTPAGPDPAATTVPRS